jgi:glycosyltransferase involved in cell wall biosynthesis
MGQEKAFRRNNFEVDVLYPDDQGAVILNEYDGNKCLFKGSRMTYREKGIVSKMIYHYRVSMNGSIDFSDSFETIVKKRYDAIYLRFFLPGKDLVFFLKKLKRHSPSTLILLEYPTLNIRELFNRGFIPKVAYFINRKKVKRLNQLADYIITLTKDKRLFGKPSIFMANGIDLEQIHPVKTPELDGNIYLLGVASDCAFYHGFDKIIRGMSLYRQKGGQPAVNFRIVSNMLSNHLNELKKLATELKVEDWIEFHPTLSREELSAMYGKIHLGVGTLALHRINLMDNYSLKHREYAAFGLPFIMSRGDEHFEKSPFVYTIERDEEPVNIESLVDFYLNLCDKDPNYPAAFRKSVENSISWEAQMRQVFEVITNKSAVTTSE